MEDVLAEEATVPVVMVVIAEVEDPLAVVVTILVEVIEVSVVPDEAAVMDIVADPELDMEPEAEAEDGTG